MSNDSGGHVVYKETGSTAFSFSGFQWREIKLKAAPCPSNKPPDHSRRPAYRAGGFSYKDTSSLSSLTRNRFIIWHYLEGRLKLLEISLDVELAYNAVELVLESPDLLPDVSIHEVGIYDVMVLFGTSTTVYRLILPHPVRIKRTPTLCGAAGKGKVPSVLNFASEASFIGPNSAALFNQVNSVPEVTCCAACANIDRVTTFALASPSGSIVIIQLQEQGLPIRTMLQETSVMTKLLSSFLGKRSVGGVSEDAPLALLAHEFDEQAVVLAVCADFNLRVWSVQLSQCVMTHALSDYLLNKDEDTSGIEVDQISLRAAPDSTPSMFRFAVHLRSGSLTQISIFEVELVNNQLHMLLLHSCACPEDAVLVDFTVSRSEILGVWQSKMKDSETDKIAIKQVIYGNVPTGWRDVSVVSLPDSQLLLLPHLEPREFYLDAIFYPGRFSTHAIYKALELYEAPESSDYVPSLENLAKEVTLRVEQEVQSSAGSLQLDCEEYHQLSLKYWSKFYRCCVEYQELASQPVALVQDPRTGMGLVLKQGLFTFLRPAHPVECIDSSIPHQGENSQLVGSIRKFISCIRQTLNKLSPEILESFIFELGCYGSADINPPIVLAGDLAQTIQNENWDEELYKQLVALKEDITPIIHTLLAALNPGQDDAEMGSAEDMDEEDGYTEDADLLKAIGNLFGGPVAMTVLSSSLLELCQYRLCLCRDILVVLLMLRRRGGREILSYVSNTNYQTEFSLLIQRYYSLYWMASHNYTPSRQASDPNLVNLQQLAALDISGSGDKSRQSSSPCTLTSLSPLPLAFLSLHGCKHIVAELVKRRGMFQDGSPSLWATCFPAVLDNFIKAVWPVDRASEVAKFLLDSSQHCYLQTYVETVVGSHNLPSDYTLYFLLGQSLIQTGEVEKAFSCFNRASNGIMSHNNPFLRRLVDCQSGDGKMSKEMKKERKETCLARYYERVMRLFEEVAAPRYVILVAQEATRLLRSNDSKSTVFWSIQFKYNLEFGDGKEAYEAMMSIPDHTLRVDCLRQLIIVMTEQNRIRELCEFKYNGLEREVEEVMEQRARNVDVVKHHYYDLLYCYHVARNNRRKAAYVMYEHALRLQREVKGPEALRKQANCYSMTILLLRLVDSKYAWVLRPVQEVPSDGHKSKRKRPRSGEKKDVQMVEVLTIADIDKTYSLVRAKLKLLQVLRRGTTLESQLSSPFMSVEDVVSLMVQAGMFDDAVQLATKFSLPLTNIFEALASRCVHLSMNFVALADPSADNPEWEWLELNKTLDNVKVKENSIADKAWYLLEAGMDQLRKCDHVIVQRGVARKLLSMGHTLPQWLVDKYKRTNAPELLYLYLTFDLLELAALLAIEYIDGVMGHGKEYFGLETALHAATPSVWLPHHLLSHLQLALDNAPQKTEFEKLSQRFTDKVEQYLEQAGAVSDSIEHCKNSL